MDDKLLHEIEDMQARLEIMSRKKAYNMNNIYFLSGAFFFLIFMLSLTQQSLLFSSIALVSFVISTSAFLRIVADVFYYKRDNMFALLLSVGVISILGIGYYALWTFVLKKISLLVLAYGAGVIGLCGLFYLLHAYMSYYQNKAKQESVLTALILALSIVILGLAVLYKHMITYLLLIVATLILIKAVYDFSQRFVREEE